MHSMSVSSITTRNNTRKDLIGRNLSSYIINYWKLKWSQIINSSGNSPGNSSGNSSGNMSLELFSFLILLSSSFVCDSSPRRWKINKSWEDVTSILELYEKWVQPYRRTVPRRLTIRLWTNNSLNIVITAFNSFQRNEEWCFKSLKFYTPDIIILFSDYQSWSSMSPL